MSRTRIEEEKRAALSEPARLLLENVERWIAEMPAETVEVIKEILPEEDDGYGSELLLTFLPRKQNTCQLRVGVIPNAVFPFHFALGDLKRVADAKGVTVSWCVAAQVPLFCEPRVELSVDEMFAVCEAVAKAKIALTIGILHGSLVVTEGHVETRMGTLSLQGTGGSMVVMRLARRFGWGEILSVQFEPWI